MTTPRVGEGGRCGAAALGYWRHGRSVLALRPRDKRPLFPWEILQRDRAGEASVRHWFASQPKANVGIVTGAVSGLVVLDVDPAHGGDQSLAELEDEHGALPATVEAVTGSGGRHLYFRHPGHELRNRAGIRPGLDLRGDGGYVVAPPSIHPNGRPYVWRAGRSPDEAELAPLPDWLLGDVIRRTGHKASDWRRIAREGVAAGERNTTAASLAGHLLYKGVDPGVVRELLIAWNEARCRPPLSRAEILSVVRNIIRLHEREPAP